MRGLKGFSLTSCLALPDPLDATAESERERERESERDPLIVPGLLGLGVSLPTRTGARVSDRTG